MAGLVDRERPYWIRAREGRINYLHIEGKSRAVAKGDVVEEFPSDFAVDPGRPPSCMFRRGNGPLRLQFFFVELEEEPCAPSSPMRNN